MSTYEERRKAQRDREAALDGPTPLDLLKGQRPPGPVTIDPTQKMILSEIQERFRRTQKAQFPRGVASSDQFRDIVRTWLSGCRETLWMVNNAKPGEVHVNVLISLWETCFRHIYADSSWNPGIEWRWW